MVNEAKAIRNETTGRPTKLNPEVADAICAAVASGSSVTLELRQLKIDAWSYNRWLRVTPSFAGRLTRQRPFATRWQAQDQPQSKARQRAASPATKDKRTSVQRALDAEAKVSAS